MPESFNTPKQSATSSTGVLNGTEANANRSKKNMKI